MEWSDLEKMTVVKLREEAHEKGLKGVHGMNKAQLLTELASAMGIEPPKEGMEGRAAESKSELKQQIRELKTRRNELLTAHDSKALKEVRRTIHGLKRRIRRLQAKSA